MDFKNVNEHWCLYDTILIGTDSDGNQPVTGWYASPAALAAANRIFFYNQRTRAVGLPYNNQDVRDQMPYAYRIYSGGVTFWANSMTGVHEGSTGDTSLVTDDSSPFIFCNDMPRHCSFTLQIQQDDILKSTALLVPPGYGPQGGGMGKGEIRTRFLQAVPNGYMAAGQSLPHISNRWDFPKPIEVPRNAALSVNMEFSEYAKAVLGTLNFDQWEDAADNSEFYSKTRPWWGIQVTLIGERLIQQRGEYHR